MSAPTLRRDARPTPPAAAGPGGLRAGTAAGSWALLAGLAAILVPVLAVWAADPRSTAGAVTALRTGGLLWLLAHGAPLDLPSGQLSLTPLGLVLLPLGLSARAGLVAARRAAPRRLTDGVRLAVGVALPSAAAAAVLGVVAPTAHAGASASSAVLAVGALALVGGAAGALRASADLRGRAAARVPAAVRTVAAPAASAVLVLLAAGALLVGVQLVRSAGAAAELWRATAPGPVGGVALLLLGLVLVPTAVVWGACWWAGPGVAVGTGTALGPFGVALGPVPAVPLLAALPAGDLPLGLGLLALVVPVLAGGLAGLLVVRRGSTRPLTDAALCGPAAGLAVGALALLGSGAAGGGRLAELGPSAWRCALAVTLEVAVGAALSAAVASRRWTAGP